MSAKFLQAIAQFLYAIILVIPTFCYIDFISYTPCYYTILYTECTLSAQYLNSVILFIFTYTSITLPQLKTLHLVSAILSYNKQQNEWMSAVNTCSYLEFNLLILKKCLTIILLSSAKKFRETMHINFSMMLKWNIGLN